MFFLHKISAKVQISTVQLHGVDLIDIQIQNWFGELYLQIDGVMVGSSLGATFWVIPELY